MARRSGGKVTQKNTSRGEFARNIIGANCYIYLELTHSLTPVVLTRLWFVGKENISSSHTHNSTMAQHTNNSSTFYGASPPSPSDSVSLGESDTATEEHTSTYSSTGDEESPSPDNRDSTSTTTTPTFRSAATLPRRSNTVRRTATPYQRASVPTLQRQNASLGNNYGPDFWTTPPVPAISCPRCGWLIRTPSLPATRRSTPWHAPCSETTHHMNPHMNPRTLNSLRGSNRGFWRNLTRR